MSLSERLINSSSDVVDQLTKTDYVQKVLLTGDVSGDNKKVFQRVLRLATTLKDISAKTMPKVLALTTLKPEEKAFFEKVAAELPGKFGKYLEEFNAAVGPVSDEAVPPEVSQSIKERIAKFDELLAKGSVPHLLVATLPTYAIPVAVQKYVYSNPSYKANKYTDLATRKDLGLDKTLEAVRGFLDARAGEVTDEEELKALYRRVAELQLKAAQRLYSG